MQLILPQMKDMHRERRPLYRRTEVPPPMILTGRDKAIIAAIHEHEGVLADWQLKKLFFQSDRAMKARLSTLYHSRFLERCNRQEQASLGFMAYWLDEQGITYLCTQSGITPEELKPRAKLERWSLLLHDIHLNEVRIAMTQAVAALPATRITTYINSRAFWRDHDTITFKDEHGKSQKRDMRPDGFFQIVSTAGNKHLQSAWFLELDLRSEHNKRVVHEKVRPGIAYVESQRFRERFNVERARWLVMTTGAARVKNMHQAAERVGKAARSFYYTTIEQAIQAGAFFTKPIWARPGSREAVSLFSTAS